jgi:hypothetical protein
MIKQIFSKKDRQEYSFMYLIPILFLGAVLRIYHLGAVSVWFDEALDILNLDEINLEKIITYKNACFSAAHVFIN